MVARLTSTVIRYQKVAVSSTAMLILFAALMSVGYRHPTPLAICLLCLVPYGSHRGKQNESSISRLLVPPYAFKMMFRLGWSPASNSEAGGHDLEGKGITDRCSVQYCLCLFPIPK